MAAQRSKEQCSCDQDRARLPLPVCVCMVQAVLRSVCAEHPGPGPTRQALNHQASSALFEGGAGGGGVRVSIRQVSSVITSGDCRGRHILSFPVYVFLY